MRWKRSRWVPSAWATAALIGSAWRRRTILSPGWRATSVARSPTIRSCISVNDSPPGNRNIDRLPVCTVRHSGSLLRSFSFAPVHSPKSHSSSPRLMRAPQAERRGDGRGRLAGAFERRGVDRGDVLDPGDAGGDGVGLVAGPSRRGAGRGRARGGSPVVDV